MSDLEFYLYADELWCMHQDGRNEQVTEKSTEIIKSVMERIRECYPEAYESLMKWYKKSASNVPYFQFLMVNRFCRCNFGELDTTKKDVDSEGCFHFEHVKCPMRGECQYENIVCNPRFNSRLSQAEIRVMRCVYQGMDNEEIADALYLSPHTVKNHIKSVYLKLGIHEKAEFIRYASVNSLFDNKDNNF